MSEPPRPVPRWPAVDVWIVDLAAPATDTVLSADELARAARFRFPEHRRRFVNRRSALRHLLSAFTGIAPPDLTFTLGTQGKPALAQGSGAIAFNASSTQNTALVAIAGRSIGVDIETIAALDDMPSLVRWLCTDAEARFIMRMPVADRPRAFFRIWAAKEAVVKASGAGLTAELKGIETNFASPTLAPTEEGRPVGLTEIDIHAGCCAAVATADATASPVVTLHRFPAGA